MLVTKNALEYYDREQFDLEYEKQKKILENQNRIRENQKKKRRKAQSAQKLLVVGLAIIGLVLSLYILQGYANITKMRHEITGLENQKQELIREKDDLIGELEAIKSPVKVKEDAIAKLGMDHPAEEQVVYIDVKELDFADTKDNMDIESGSSIVKRLKNALNLLVGLF